MRENIKRIIGCLITLSIIAYVTGKLGYWVRPIDTDGCYAQIESYHSLPENSVEVIIYGSSHAFRGISTKELYEQYGIGSYNYGWHWQTINTTRLFIEDSLMTQKPRVVLIEAGLADQVLHNGNISAQIYYSRYIKNDQARQEYLRMCFGNHFKQYVAYYFPLYPFHDNWSSLTKHSFQPLGGIEFYRRNMGFCPSDKTYSVNIGDPSDFEQLDFNSYSLAELDKIVSLCKKNNIQIVFYTVPFQSEYHYGNAMTKYAEEHDCKYFDLFKLYDDVGFNSETDFFDVAHLNTSGSEKVADFLGKYLVENYELTDMRTIENNLWEQNFYGE